MTSPRLLRMELRLDPHGHGLLQLATMAFVRPDVTSLALLEDVRLALDEVLLHDAVTKTPSVHLEVASRRDDIAVVLTIAGDVEVETDALGALVDELMVSRCDGETTVRFVRRFRR